MEPLLLLETHRHIELQSAHLLKTDNMVFNQGALISLGTARLTPNEPGPVAWFRTKMLINQRLLNPKPLPPHQLNSEYTK